MLISGLRGLGKSFLAKVMAVREIEYGRHVIVQSDRQGEWARVAGHVGEQVVAPGRGRVINPFKPPGHRVAGGEQASWASEVMAARRKAITTIAEALSPDGRPVLDKDMGTIVDAVVASFGAGPMTLTALVDRLADWEWVGGHHREFRGFEFQESLLARRLAAAIPLRVRVRRVGVPGVGRERGMAGVLALPVWLLALAGVAGVWVFWDAYRDSDERIIAPPEEKDGENKRRGGSARPRTIVAPAPWMVPPVGLEPTLRRF